MSITTELREWAQTLDTPKRVMFDAYRIADRIDAEHADMQAFCDRLKEAAQGREDVTLFDVDYVALPVDADGVPIRVGDEMEPISVKYDRFGVVTLCLDTRDGRWSLLTDLDGEWSHDELCQLRHYHAPKVDDVLREFADKVRRCCDTADTIAEYAAKLRLAEGEDE